MIEIPESVTLAKQLKTELQGKKVESVVAAQSPHKFAWYHGEPEGYDSKLRGKTVEDVRHHGGRVEIYFDGNTRLCFNDGTNLTYLGKGEKRPPKHQLLLEFEGGSALAVKVQMYGGMMAFQAGELDDNFYYRVCTEKPDPFTEEFSREYFGGLVRSADLKKLSAKAFLGTEQRIPGVGNGVLQDILWRAKVNPRKKMADLSDSELDVLFEQLKETLRQMAAGGGRDTEKDAYGKPGGYRTVMSKNNTEMVCPACGGGVRKESYLGGSVYYCPTCQPYEKGKK